MRKFCLLSNFRDRQTILVAYRDAVCIYLSLYLVIYLSIYLSIYWYQLNNITFFTGWRGPWGRRYNEESEENVCWHIRRTAVRNTHIHSHEEGTAADSPITSQNPQSMWNQFGPELCGKLRICSEAFIVIA